LVPTLGILASGRGSNCEAILRAVAAGELEARVGLVLSDRAEAPVLQLASRYGVPALYLDPGRSGARLAPAAEAGYVQALQGAGVDWIALAGFMRILGQPLLEAYAGRIVNIHPSLLPAFPGLHAQRQAVDYGVKVAGCTVHFVEGGVDTGPIIRQAAVPVHEDDTEETLSARILTEEHRIYVEGLRLVLSGRCRIEGRRVRSEKET
jgi:phosphoribosylglycinamide formyltransferase-1